MYRANPTLRVLLRLSERRQVEPDMVIAALKEAPQLVQQMRLGYVLVDRTTASAEVIAFAEGAFSLTLLAEDKGFVLYRTAFQEE